MWNYLTYDKVTNNNHSYINKLTKNITYQDLNDGDYRLYSGKEGVKFYIENTSNQEVIPESVLNSDLYRVLVYNKVENNINFIIVIIGVDVSKLNLNNIPNIEFLKDLCMAHLRYTVDDCKFYNTKDNTFDYIINKANQDTDYTLDDKINDLDELKIKLYNYQKCSIQWMLNKESTIKEIKYTPNLILDLGDIYYDTNGRIFRGQYEKKILKFNGGALIDEVGLGKTIQMITLSLMNPSNDISYVRQGIKNKLFSRATLIICPNQLCGQWAREFKNMVSSECDIITIMTKRHFDKYTYQDLLDADFVIVSYTFFDNINFTKLWTPKLSTMKNYHKKMNNDTEGKVKRLFNQMGEELVNDPFNSLMKKNPLFQLIHWHRIIIDEFHEIDTDTKYCYINNMLPYIESKYRWVVTATPFIKSSGLFNIINFLSNYGTSEITYQDIYKNDNLVDYISSNCFRKNTKDSVKNEYTIPDMIENVKWLNFTQTERMMYNAYLADPSHDKFGTYLRQLCCHPQLAEETKLSLANCKSLKEIEIMMVSHYKTNVDLEQIKVDKINKKINIINNKIKIREEEVKLKKKRNVDYDNVDTDEDMLAFLIEEGIDISLYKNGMYKISLKKLKEMLEKLLLSLKNAQDILNCKLATYNFFTNVVSRIHKTVKKESTKTNNFDIDNFDINNFDDDDDSESNDDDEICGICMDIIDQKNVGVTKCGHIFCFQCLQVAVNKFNNCPMCKTKLKTKDIFVMSYEKKETKNTTPEIIAKNELINIVGTKLANLIFFLRESDQHTIIFSQWDDLLKKIGKVLDKNGILNVFCKGNCYQRDKAIRDFHNNNKIKVIMLSSNSSASGTNITKATQIIFIDPIYGDYKYRRDQEKQAMGRSHRLGQTKQITVNRFIIKETVEEDIYNMNIEEDNNTKF